MLEERPVGSATPCYATLLCSVINALRLQVNGIPEERKVAEALDL